MKWLKFIPILLVPILVHAQGWQWAQGVGSNSNTNGSSVSTDAAGNVYATGIFSGSSTVFGTTTLSGNGAYLLKYDAAGNLQWCRGTMGGFTTSVTADHFGNVYIAGAFSDSLMTIGTTTLVNKAYGFPRTVFVTFLAKYDGSGNFIWARNAGDRDGINITYSATTDQVGNIYVAGEMGSDTLVFGTKRLISTNKARAYNAFIAKYNPSGDVIWAKNGGGPGMSSTAAGDEASSVYADAFGNVYLAGSLQDTSISFGSITLHHGLSNEGTYNGFVFRFDTAGNAIWGRAHGGGNWGNSRYIAADAAGNVYSTGMFNVPSITINSTTGSKTLTNVGGGVNIHLVKYDSLGNVLWAKNAGGNGGQIFSGAIACDFYGNIFITGSFNSPTVDFDGITLSNPNSGRNVFLVKYDPCGNVIYATSSGGSGSNSTTGSSIAISRPDKVYVTGQFGNPDITFGTTTLTNNTSGNIGMFLAKWVWTYPDTACELLDMVPTIAHHQYEIKLYPNPATTTICIDDVQATTTYTLSNAIGAIVQKGTIKQGRNSIDIGNLVNGVYLLRIDNMTVKKFIKL